MLGLREQIWGLDGCRGGRGDRQMDGSRMDGWRDGRIDIRKITLDIGPLEPLPKRRWGGCHASTSI